MSNPWHLSMIIQSDFYFSHPEDTSEKHGHFFIPFTSVTLKILLTGELWGVFSEYLWENWPRYNRTTLYRGLHIILLHIEYYCLNITPSHDHRCANLPEDIELKKCPSDIFCRVCKIKHIPSGIH